MSLTRIFDTSGYQPNFDYAGSGGDAFLIKATEGAVGYYANPYFSAQLGRAQATGRPAVAYHYVRGTDVSGQVEAVSRVVPKSVPVVLDLEAGGDLVTTRALAAALRGVGYAVPLLYCPNWWLSANGGSGQNTADIAPLWSSNYTTYSDTGPGWAAYGGQTPVLWQYTNAYGAGGYSVDASAFRGTSDQLAALLLGTAQPNTRGPIMGTYYRLQGTNLVGCLLENSDFIGAPPPAGVAATDVPQIVWDDLVGRYKKITHETMDYLIAHLPVTTTSPPAAGAVTLAESSGTYHFTPSV